LRNVFFLNGGWGGRPVIGHVTGTCRVHTGDHWSDGSVNGVDVRREHARHTVHSIHRLDYYNSLSRRVLLTYTHDLMTSPVSAARRKHLQPRKQATRVMYKKA